MTTTTVLFNSYILNVIDSFNVHFKSWSHRPYRDRYWLRFVIIAQIWCSRKSMELCAARQYTAQRKTMIRSKIFFRVWTTRTQNKQQYVVDTYIHYIQWYEPKPSKALYVLIYTPCGMEAHRMRVVYTDGLNCTPIKHAKRRVNKKNK